MSEESRLKNAVIVLGGDADNVSLLSSNADGSGGISGTLAIGDQLTVLAHWASPTLLHKLADSFRELAEWRERLLRANE